MVLQSSLNRIEALENAYQKLSKPSTDLSVTS
jgi:hypothetical protein